jgi:hypothetical protein
MSNVLPYINQTKKFTNQQYRKWFRENHISAWYRPWIHIGFNGGILLAAVIYNLLLIQDWSLQVLAIFFLTLIFGNFVVWFVHRYPLHRRFKFWTFPYDTHTVMHHRYFTADYITYDDSKDFYAVFFPAHVVAGFVLVAQPLFYFVFAGIFNSTLGHAFAASAAFYFLLYEFVHWSSHLKENHILMRIPWLSFMRKHHIAHHNPRLMMKYNFCIVHPLMDYLLGTYYKAESLPQDNFEDHYRDVENNLNSKK